MVLKVQPIANHVTLCNLVRRYSLIDSQNIIRANEIFFFFFFFFLMTFGSNNAAKYLKLPKVSCFFLNLTSLR